VSANAKAKSERLFVSFMVRKSIDSGARGQK
jgi:hypothetical protein